MSSDKENDPNVLPKIMHTCYCGYSLIGAYEFLGGQAGDERNVLPKAAHTCYCGYSLLSAYGFIGQEGVSRLMLSHLEAVHGIES